MSHVINSSQAVYRFDGPDINNGSFSTSESTSQIYNGGEVSTSHTFKLDANDQIDILAMAASDTDWLVSANRLSAFSGFMVG